MDTKKMNIKVKMEALHLASANLPPGHNRGKVIYHPESGTLAVVIGCYLDTGKVKFRYKVRKFDKAKGLGGETDWTIEACSFPAVTIQMTEFSV